MCFYTDDMLLLRLSHKCVYLVGFKQVWRFWSTEDQHRQKYFVLIRLDEDRNVKLALKVDFEAHEHMNEVRVKPDKLACSHISS